MSIPRTLCRHQDLAHDSPCAGQLTCRGSAAGQSLPASVLFVLVCVASVPGLPVKSLGMERSESFYWQSGSLWLLSLLPYLPQQCNRHLGATLAREYRLLTWDTVSLKSRRKADISAFMLVLSPLFWLNFCLTKVSHCLPGIKVQGWGITLTLSSWMTWDFRDKTDLSTSLWQGSDATHPPGNGEPGGQTPPQMRTNIYLYFVHNYVLWTRSCGNQIDPTLWAMSVMKRLTTH